MVRALLTCSLYNIAYLSRLRLAISENICYRWFVSSPSTTRYSISLAEMHTFSTGNRNSRYQTSTPPLHWTPQTAVPHAAAAWSDCCWGARMVLKRTSCVLSSWATMTRTRNAEV